MITQNSKPLEVPITLPDDPASHRLVKNAKCTVPVDLRADKTSVMIQLVLRSKETEGDRREWLWREAIEFGLAPRVRVLR
jgi:hypothetical protein